MKHFYTNEEIYKLLRSGMIEMVSYSQSGEGYLKFGVVVHEDFHGIILCEEFWLHSTNKDSKYETNALERISHHDIIARNKLKVIM